MNIVAICLTYIYINAHKYIYIYINICIYENTVCTPANHVTSSAAATQMTVIPAINTKVVRVVNSLVSTTQTGLCKIFSMKYRSSCHIFPNFDALTDRLQAFCRGFMRPQPLERASMTPHESHLWTFCFSRQKQDSLYPPPQTPPPKKKTESIELWKPKWI